MRQTRFRALVVAGLLASFLAKPANTHSNTPESQGELSRLAEVVTRDGVNKVLDIDSARMLGFGAVERAYKFIKVKESPKHLRDVELFVIDGKTYLVLGRIAGDDAWMVRTSPTGEYGKCVHSDLSTGKYDEWSVEQGQKILAVEKTYWLDWLAKAPPK